VEEDSEEHVDTVALGWTGLDVYVGMTDTRVSDHRRVAGRLRRETALAPSFEVLCSRD
jgi:hypothetical protein